MNEDEQDLPEDSPEKLSRLQHAWCVFMLGITLASAAVFGDFLNDMLYPEEGLTLRFELDDLTPRPGFDL